MSKNDEALMMRHGITDEKKVIYSYKSFRYDNLNDAVRYAELDEKRKTTDKKLPE
ncbi:MAG: hypothetical protein ACRBCI_10090 [Cellvibrionaceae bacterium]